MNEPIAGTSAAETGRRGEEAAAEYLVQQGYRLCARNWRAGRYELDIVAAKGEVLHIVEVKTRRADALTGPEAAATAQKFRALRCAAERYLAQNTWQGEVQFDLAAVDATPDGRYTVRLIECAMESHW